MTPLSVFNLGAFVYWIPRAEYIIFPNLTFKHSLSESAANGSDGVIIYTMITISATISIFT